MGDVEVADRTPVSEEPCEQTPEALSDDEENDIEVAGTPEIGDVTPAAEIDDEQEMETDSNTTPVKTFAPIVPPVAPVVPPKDTKKRPRAEGGKPAAKQRKLRKD